MTRVLERRGDHRNSGRRRGPRRTRHVDLIGCVSDLRKQCRGVRRPTGQRPDHVGDYRGGPRLPIADALRGRGIGHGRVELIRDLGRQVHLLIQEVTDVVSQKRDAGKVSKQRRFHTDDWNRYECEPSLHVWVAG